MNKNLWLNKIGILAILFSILIISCNKDVDAPVANDRPVTTGKSIGKILSENSSYSLLLALANKVGLAGALSDSSKIFTVFAPDNNAIKQFVSIYTNGAVSPTLPDNIFLGIISSASPGLTDTLRNIVNYHIIPGQAIKAAGIKSTFPNAQMPTGFQVNTNPLVRLSSFLSKTPSSAWVNNIPVTAPDLATASNGVIHGIPAILLPPSKNLWESIDTDPQLTYLKAAINRADQASTASKDSLRVALKNFLLNATVFAPTDDAFKSFITNALLSRGVPQTTVDFLIASYGTTLITNPGAVPVLGPTLASVISPSNVKGIVVYHVLSSQSGNFAPPGIRVFSNNIPEAVTPVKTLFNSVFSAHPGVTVSATFTGPFVTAATVKGSVNATASNVIISAPPSNTHDLHNTNGVIHKIDQVLVPIPL